MDDAHSSSGVAEDDDDRLALIIGETELQRRRPDGRVRAVAHATDRAPRYFEDFASVLCTTGRCFFVFGGKIFPSTQRTGS